MNGLFIVPHLGLGDAIILCGAVRVLAQQRPVIFPCKAHNFPSVQAMFSDSTRINVLAVRGDEDMLEQAANHPNSLKLGMFGPNWMPKDDPARFDEQMYRDAGVNFECSWSHFKTPWSPHKLDPIVDVFLCEDAGRGYRINRDWIGPGRQITSPHITETIFYWEPYIRNAREMHCIDSSFKNWIDRMPSVPGQGLFWHKYARIYPDIRFDPTHRRNWKVIT